MHVREIRRLPIRVIKPSPNSSPEASDAHISRKISSHNHAHVFLPTVFLFLVNTPQSNTKVNPAKIKTLNLHRILTPL
jgi:hypothetical protein